MSFFWPGEVKPQPNAMVRLGRVLHWTITAVAVAMVVAAFADDYSRALLSDPRAGFWYWLANTTIAGAPFVFIFGRAVRYILSGE